MHFYHVDVFADHPFAGNGTVVFLGGVDRGADELQAITREMRQFESVFVTRTPAGVTARIFSLVEELAFAGHPLLGAAAALHDAWEARNSAIWSFELGARPVRIQSTRGDGYYTASMDQGRPAFGTSPEPGLCRSIMTALNLSESNLAANPQIVSTGLRYLIVPVTSGLDEAQITGPIFADLLAAAGAQFVYVLDVSRREGRHWENDGSIEDVATGSAAGPAGAWLVANGLAEPGEQIVLHQGRWVGRPSSIYVSVQGVRDHITGVEVAGPVVVVARGDLNESQDSAAVANRGVESA